MAQSHGLGIRDVIRPVAPTVVRRWERIGRAASVIFILALAFGAQVARGQGTSGNFTDPIRLIELTDLLQKNGVEYRDAYPAIEAAHVKYLESCLELRNQHIQRFQEKMQGLEAGDKMPSSEEVQKMFDVYLGLIKRSAALDQTLFDAVRDALPQTMHVGLAQARATRDRAVWSSPQMWDSAEGEGVDVPVLLRGLDWSEVAAAAALRTECDRALSDFDGRHGKLLRELVAASMKAAVEMATALSATKRVTQQNIGEMDEQQVKDSMIASEAAYNKVRLPLVELRKALRESSARAYRAAWAVLAHHDAKIARQFRSAYLAAAYPRFDDGLASGVGQAANSALRLKRLSDDQRGAIRSIFAQWQVADDRVLDQIIVKENRRWFEENAVEDHTALDALTTEIAADEYKRAHAAGNARAAISSAIGPDAGEILGKLGTPEEAELFLPADQAGLDGAREGALDVGGSGLNEQQGGLLRVDLAVWNARRMDDAWMSRIAGSLGSGAGALAILQTLKEDYWKEWDARIKPELDQIAALAKKKPPTVDGGNSVPLIAITDEADVDRWVARAAATEKIRHEIEDRFFADVGSVVADPAQAPIVEMLRTGRICGDHVDGLDSLFDGIDGGEENANAILAATGVQLASVDCAKVAVALAPALAGLQKSAQAMQATAVEYWRILRLNEIGWSNYAKTTDQSRWGDFYRVMQEREEAVRSVGMAAARTKAALQRDAFEAIIAVVPHSARKVVQGAYFRDAYFNAYGETESTAEGLAKACALTDLTESQRGALSIARDEFMAERDAAVEAMIQQMKTEPKTGQEAQGATAGANAQEQAWLAARSRMEEMERYAFARDSARDKLILRLKNTLNAEQLRKAGIK